MKMKVVIGRSEIEQACNEYIQKHYNLSPSMDKEPTIKARSGYLLRRWKILEDEVFFNIAVEEPGQKK